MTLRRPAAFQADGDDILYTSIEKCLTCPGNKPLSKLTTTMKATIWTGTAGIFAVGACSRSVRHNPLESVRQALMREESWKDSFLVGLRSVSGKPVVSSSACREAYSRACSQR